MENKTLKREDLKKLHQGSLLIVFKQDTPEEKRNKIIQALYLNNIDSIESMLYAEAKLGTNMSSDWIKFRDNFNNKDK